MTRKYYLFMINTGLVTKWPEKNIPGRPGVKEDTLVYLNVY